MDYRKASEPTSTTNNECVSAALGENRTRSPEDEFNCIPTVKFPSQEDEYETLKLFRRCAGPLAATIAGRVKLSREGESIYGDGRPLQLCRVAGCQNKYGPRRMLCNWHRVMIESAKEGVMTNKRWKPQLLDSDNEVGGRGGSEQKPAASQMVESRRIFTAVVTKPSNDTKLGIGIQNGKGSIEITSIAPGSLLAGTELKVGMKIESINGRSFLACADCKTCADFLGSAVGEVTIMASSVTAPLGRHYTQEVDPASRKRPFIDIKEAASSCVVPPKTKAPLLSNDSSKSQQKSSEPATMAVDIPLEPAEAEIEQFMGC